MTDFKNFQYYNFKKGLDCKNSPPLVVQSEKECAWSESSYNVELLSGGGIVKMNGSQLIAQLPDANTDEIIGGFEGETSGTSYLVIVTKNGNFYYYDNNTFVLKKSGLTSNAKPNFKKYLNGVFVSNGADDPFLFIPGNNPEILQANATSSGGTNIRGQALEIYKGRVWIACGSTIYYSALGKYNDWTTANDAGSISNFHNDTSPITALCNFKDYLVIHKEEASFILSGNSPENFTIQPFSNLGATSPFGVNSANGRHIFYNKEIYPFVVNDLGEIAQGSAISYIIENKLKEFLNTKNSQCIFLNYKEKSQLWCFLYKSNEDYFNTILIYDYINNAWFVRIVPYDIASAWEYDGSVYCGLKNGKVVKESAGTSFLGESIPFFWSSPFFHFGSVNSQKTIERLSLVLAMDKDNYFKMQTKKNYSPYEISDKDEFSSINSNTLVFTDANGEHGQGVLDSDVQTYGYITLPADKVSNYFANVTGSNKSVQIQIYGDKSYHSLALLGLEFQDVFFDA